MRLAWIYEFLGLTGIFWVLASALLAGLGGHHDTGGGDLSLDGAHADTGHLDADSGHAEPGFPFLSPYVIAAFLAGLGITGTTLLSLGLPALVHLPAALAGGALLGGGIGLFLHKLRTTWSTSAVTRRHHLLGASAEVSVSIPEGKVGEVRLVAGGKRLTLAARTVDGRPLPTGASVRIETLEGATAIVREPTPARLERSEKAP